MNQTSWIYRIEATASCCILYNAVVEDKATLGSDLSRTTAAYTIRAVTCLLPSIYDYAGAHNAVNPALYNRAWPTNLLFYKENPLFNNLQSLQEEFMRKLATAIGTILKENAISFPRPPEKPQSAPLPPMYGRTYYTVKTNLRSCHCEEAEGRRGNPKPSEARRLLRRFSPRNDIHRLTLTEY